MKKEIIEYVFKEGDTVRGVVKGRCGINLNEEQINNIINEIFLINGKKQFKLGEKVKLVVYLE